MAGIVLAGVAIGEALADAVAVTTGVADGEADAVGDGVADGVGVGVGLGVGVGATSVRRGSVITRRGTEPPRKPAPTTSKVPKVTLALYSLTTSGRDLSNVLMTKSPSLASKSRAPAFDAQTGPNVLSPSLSWCTKNAQPSPAYAFNGSSGSDKKRLNHVVPTPPPPPPPPPPAAGGA